MRVDYRMQHGRQDEFASKRFGLGRTGPGQGGRGGRGRVIVGIGMGLGEGQHLDGWEMMADGIRTWVGGWEKKRNRRKRSEESRKTAKAGTSTIVRWGGKTTISGTLCCRMAPRRGDFAQQQGQVTWPVERGTITVEFGTASAPYSGDDVRMMVNSCGQRCAAIGEVVINADPSAEG